MNELAHATQIGSYRPAGIDVPLSPGPGDLQQLAREILDVGQRRFRFDDYGARMEAFAQILNQLPESSRADLMAEVIRQDPGAFQSWIKLDLLSGGLESGSISESAFQAVASTFVEAAVRGDIRDFEVDNFLGLSWGLSDRAPGLVPQQWDRVRGFLDAAQEAGPVHETRTIALRETIAGNLLDRALDSNSLHNFHDAGIAMQLAADSGQADMAARLLLGYSPGQQAVLLSEIAGSSIGFQNSLGELPTLSNPMSVLIDSVASLPAAAQDGQVNAAGELAISIARFAHLGEREAFFDPYSGEPIQNVAESLSRLLVSPHGDAVLDALTTWDDSFVVGAHGHAQRFGLNAIQLGNLLRVTAFNSDNPLAESVIEAVSEFAQHRVNYLNGIDAPAGSGTAVDLNDTSAAQQLAILGAAASDAVVQMQIDVRNRQEATAQLVGFAVDVVVALIPGGGKVSSLLVNDLKQTFNNDATIGRVIDQLLKPGDNLSKAVIDQLKSDITAAIGSDQASIEALRAQASSFVMRVVLAGVPTEGRAQADVSSYIQSVQSDISENRAAPGR